MRARTSGSGTPGGKLPHPPSFVLMVVTHVDVIEHGDGIVSQHGTRTVQRYQVRGDGAVVDAHIANRESGALFAGKSRLEKPNAPLLLFPNTHQEDLRLVI